MDGVGFLFLTGGGHVKVADGDIVKLGNREWQARHTGAGLELAIEHVESNGPQQVRGRHADIKNELHHRKQEVQALRAQRAELETKMEQVTAPVFSQRSNDAERLCAPCDCDQMQNDVWVHM